MLFSVKPPSQTYLRASLFGFAALALSAVSAAQQAPASPAGSQPATAPSAAFSLAGVTGVRPGMTDEALLDLAATYLQDGPKKDAERILEAVRTADPQNLRATRMLADLYDQQAQAAKESGDTSQAAVDALIDRAVGLYLTVGSALVDKGEYALAERTFAQVLMRRSANATGQLNMARLMAATGRPLMAIERYRDYLSNPSARGDADTRARANLELGEICRLTGLRNQAISALQSAEKLNPENALIRIALAKAYLDAGMLDKARITATDAVRRAPGDPEARNVLCKALLGLKAFSEARVESERAVDLGRQRVSQQPEFSELVKNLIDYCKTLVQILEAQLAGKPEDTALRADLVRTMREHADWTRVLSLHEAVKVLKATPEQARDVRLLEMLAELQNTLMNTAEVQVVCRQILQRDPANALAQRLLQSAGGQAPTTQAGTEQPSPASGS